VNERRSIQDGEATCKPSEILILENMAIGMHDASGNIWCGDRSAQERPADKHDINSQSAVGTRRLAQKLLPFTQTVTQDRPCGWHLQWSVTGTYWILRQIQIDYSRFQFDNMRLILVRTADRQKISKLG